MTDPVNDMKGRAYRTSRDPKSRRMIVMLSILLVLSILALVAQGWWYAFKQKENAQTLAQQITMACQNGDFGPGFSQEDEDAICKNAQKVIQENDPELQESEIQEREIQEPEIQEPEIQDPEDQNKESQDPETQDAETQDPEDQETETQEPEIQEEEKQDEETQDPEIDDPDPNDQIQSGSCTFDGTGTFTLTFQTSSGPVTTSCTGTGTPPGQQNNN